jgi:hypothetical protein
MQTSEYTPSLWKALEGMLSKGRLSYYLDLVEQKTNRQIGKEDKRQRAFELLLWNTHLSESLYLPLQVFEITLRNTLDASISKHAGADWYRNMAWLQSWCQPKALRDIDKALDDGSKTPRLRSSTNHNHFIAGTTLGFWVNFLSPRYQRLWEHVLKNDWQGADRDQLFKVARHANDIRNRISHYEPVMIKRFTRDMELDQLHEEILLLVGRVCQETGNWVRKNSRRRFDVAWTEKPHWWPPVGRSATNP